MSRILYTSAAGLAVAAMTATAAADSATVTFDGPSDWWVGAKVVHQLPGEDYTSPQAAVGLYDFSSDGSTLSESFQTFCLDPHQHIERGQSYQYELVDLQQAPGAPGLSETDGHMSADAADGLRELWGRHRDEVTGDQKAAAFQLAVWNLIYDTDQKVGDGEGSFYTKAGGDMVGIANTWLSELNGEGPMEMGLRALHHDEIQDQITVVDQPGPPTTVPSPTAAASSGVAMALLGLGAAMRRRRRTMLG